VSLAKWLGLFLHSSHCATSYLHSCLVQTYHKSLPACWKYIVDGLWHLVALHGFNDFTCYSCHPIAVSWSPVF
jgi:hypothetical protein